MAQRVSRLLWLALVPMACGGSPPAETAPQPAAPLPTAGIAGQPVTVYPITLVAAEETLGWSDSLTPRRTALDRADSLLGSMLQERSPEVNWVLPDALRRAARRAPGMLADPDQMGTALLRFPNAERIPDPLRSQMRALTGVAGGRFALVPASLVFVQADSGLGRAELTLVIADVRTGVVGWRTVAHAVGGTPWEVLRDAIKTLTPGLP